MGEATGAIMPVPSPGDGHASKARARGGIRREAEAAALRILADLEAESRDQALPRADRMAARRLLLEGAGKLLRATEPWQTKRPEVPAAEPGAELPRGLPGR